jgi:acyl-CoA thioester hydrolase
MSRIKINLPEKFTFHCKIPVRITDINYGNHLGNDSVLSIIHEARVQFLAHYGCTELNVFGKALIMADVAMAFKSEGFYGDSLEVGVMPEEFTDYGFDLLYKLTSVKTGKEIAAAKTGMVCFNYDTRKVSLLPNEFSSLFSLAL